MLTHPVRVHDLLGSLEGAATNPQSTVSNLSQKASSYLQELREQDRAESLFFHVVAILSVRSTDLKTVWRFVRIGRVCRSRFPGKRCWHPPNSAGKWSRSGYRKPM